MHIFKIHLQQIYAHIMLTQNRCTRVSTQLFTYENLQYFIEFQMVSSGEFVFSHDDVIKWKHFPRHLPFVRGIHLSPVNSPRKGQWRRAMMFSLICVWINSWVNSREAGDLRRRRVVSWLTISIITNTMYDVHISLHKPGSVFSLFGFVSVAWNMFHIYTLRSWLIISITAKTVYDIHISLRKAQLRFQFIWVCVSCTKNVSYLKSAFLTNHSHYCKDSVRHSHFSL